MNVLEFLLSALAIGVTFLYGSTGEIITEKAGHLNLGIPGIMGIGAACGCAVLNAMMPLNADAAPFLPPWLIVVLALLATLAGGAIMGLLYSFLAVTLRSNQNVTGLAMTIFGTGLTKFIFASLEKDGVTYVRAKYYFRFPFNNTTSALQYCGVMVFLGIAIAIISSVILTRTKVGLHLRAVGESPATADAAGINVTRYKYIATIIGSAIAGLGGLFYIMDYAGSNEAYLTIEALGWLSVALVIFSLWRPYLSIIGSFIFGTLFIVGAYLPTLFGLKIDVATSNLVKTLPYVVTIIVLVITSIRNRRENQPPASLGVSYFREDR
ncbi:MAG: ABC transporter permease [Clostridia bacterium]|nr:ABC transporter permease [Clostridia bacterium]